MLQIMPFFAAALICLLSLSGGVFYFISPARLKLLLPYLVSLAVGVLLGNSFIHLLPDALAEIGSIEHVSLFTASGILLFFFIEKGMRWQHHHQVYVSALPDGSSEIKPLGKMNLVGDFVHNFTDGTLIAGSFSISPELGWITTLAIAAHEIPQEISDTGSLMYSGYSLKRALMLNFLCSLSCLLGVLFIVVLQQSFSFPIAYILPITAGGFIYIAASDMMPELHGRFSVTAHIGQGIAMISGFLFMWGAAWAETLFM